jgi:hypothetical protein
VLSHVHVLPTPAPLQVWCVGQAVVAVTSRQLSESAVQVDTWLASGQNVPAAVQPAGGVLQTHDFAPAAPWQVCSGPQECVLCTITQPSLSGPQFVVSVPDEQ